MKKKQAQSKAPIKLKGSKDLSRESQKRTEQEKSAHYDTILAMWLKGFNQAAIAEKIGVSDRQVRRDIESILGAWRNSVPEYNDHVNKEIAKYDALEREYWAAWDSSKTDERSPSGDSRFLDGVLSVASRRAKLLGLDKPAKTEHTGANGTPLQIIVTETIVKAE